MYQEAQLDSIKERRRHTILSDSHREISLRSSRPNTQRLPLDPFLKRFTELRRSNFVESQGGKFRTEEKL
jgi:hypothetical protein